MLVEDNKKKEIARLKREVAAAREKHGDDVPRSASASAYRGTAMGLALRIISDLVAAIVVGTALGWGLDYLTGLSPLFLVLFFFFGLAAGISNIMRTAKEMNRDSQ